MAENDNPGRQGTVDGCQIVGEPVNLLVVTAEWTAVLGTALIWAYEAVAKVGFGIDVDEMSHSIVVGVPEVAKTAGRAARHTPMVDVAREIRLAGQADRLGVFLTGVLVGGTTVVAIRFVVPRINHVSWEVSIQSLYGEEKRKTYAFCDVMLIISSKNAFRIAS